MSISVDELNALSADRASALLRPCCGASRWVAAMVGRRPFFSHDAVLRAADDVWNGMAESDWLEAFSHHPRIGEGAPAAGGSARREAGPRRSNRRSRPPGRKRVSASRE